MLSFRIHHPAFRKLGEDQNPCLLPSGVAVALACSSVVRNAGGQRRERCLLARSRPLPRLRRLPSRYGTRTIGDENPARAAQHLC
jgi:hypothetical protein